MRRRAASFRRPSVVTGLPVGPVATAIDEVSFEWDWVDANPDHWLVEVGPTADGPWTFFANIPGDTHNSGMVGGPNFGRVTGMSSGYRAVTQPSNSVELTG